MARRPPTSWPLVRLAEADDLALGVKLCLGVELRLNTPHEISRHPKTLGKFCGIPEPDERLSEPVLSSGHAVLRFDLFAETDDVRLGVTALARTGVLQRSAAWRGAIRRGCPRCSPGTSAQRKPLHALSPAQLGFAAIAQQRPRIDRWAKFPLPRREFRPVETCFIFTWCAQPDGDDHGR
jgi:hypothetical protein